MLRHTRIVPVAAALLLLLPGSAGACPVNPPGAAYRLNELDQDLPAAFAHEAGTIAFTATLAIAPPGSLLPTHARHAGSASAAASLQRAVILREADRRLLRYTISLRSLPSRLLHTGTAPPGALIA